MQKTILFFPLLFLIFLKSNAQNKHDFFYFDTLDYHQFDVLKEDIGDARVVLLGEPDHIHGNVFSAKFEVMKMLHETMGFDIVVFESGFYDLNKSHQAIQEGESVKFAYTNSIFQIWHGNEEFHPFMDYVAEKYDSIKVLGMDNQLSGYYVETYLREDFLPFFDNDLSFEEWNDFMVHIYEYNLPSAFDIDRFIEITNQLKEKVDKSSSHQKDDLVQTLYFLIETAKDYYYNKPGQKTKEEFKAKDSNIRDRLMGENMLYLLNKYPNKKMIVWGATGHIMGRLKGYNEELDEFYPMGSYIKNELGDAAYVLAFTGKIKDVDRFETIEEEFYATGNKYGFYPLHSSKEISSTVISYDEPKNVKPLTADWSQAFDGMFFVNQLKLAKHKVYDCGESLLIKPVELQNDALKTTYSFQLENTEEVVIPTIYLKDKKSIRNQIGIVYDEKTKKILPSVSVVTTNSKRGTATDMNGKFDIAIPSPQDSIIISSIGYETIKIAPSDMDLEIFLQQKVDEMSTLTISSEPLTAKSILKKVIKSIPKNYYQGPFTKYFDNEFIHTYLKDGTTSFYKINFEVYDKNGYKSEMMFPMRYTGFRKVLEASSCPIDSIENKPLVLTKLDEKKMNLAQYGNYLLGYDIVNVRHNNFLNMSKFGKYDFEFSDVIFIDGKEVYALKFYTEENSFRSTVILEPKTFYGTIYINAEDYAITKVEYSVVHDVERLQHYYPFQKYPLEPLSFSNLSVTYKKYKDGFYYINDIIAEANIPGRPTYSHLKVMNIEIGERDREEGEYH